MLVIKDIKYVTCNNIKLISEEDTYQSYLFNNSEQPVHNGLRIIVCKIKWDTCGERKHKRVWDINP